MKKAWKIICLLVGICFLAGCSENKESETERIETLDADKEWFRYEVSVENGVIAVDENGILYVSEYVMPQSQLISAYDTLGNCLFQKEIETGLLSANDFMVRNGKLYYLAFQSNSSTTPNVLCEVDMTTWEVREVCGFSKFSSVQGMAWIGDCVYVIGRLKNAPIKNYTLHPDVVQYNYNGEAVCRVDLSAQNPTVEIMQLDYPIDIMATETGKLIIYHYTEEQGFGFLEFDPVAGTLMETGWYNTPSVIQNIVECENGFLFNKGYRLHFGTAQGTEAEVFSENVLILGKPAYVKGFVYYINQYADNAIERICIADVLKDNKEIRLLEHRDIQDDPYGCGYQMKRTILDSEQFALKVLAQDKDFDAFLLSSRDNTSYNLKENGVFYPLNEVEGVMEYLDACFPYVKEAAINEDGDIWMLPVALSIPGIVYNKAYCNSNGVDFSAMDFYEFLELTEEAGQNNLASMSSYVAVEELFGQYFQLDSSINAPLYKKYAEKYFDIFNGVGFPWDISHGELIKKGERPDFYYFYEVYQYSFSTLAKAIGTSSDFGVMGVPKLAEGIGNVGTITFLAVNPQSENLEETLEYISAFAQYMRQKKDSFMLADISTYTDTPFVRAWYEMYAGGVIRFDMDSTVYEDVFYKYLGGKMTTEDMADEIERRKQLYFGE